MSYAIIGAGRVGGALAERSREYGRPCTLYDRDRDWRPLADDEGPIVVATRNDDLETVVARVPEARRGDLVFVQNGMLRPWLARRGLESCTRGLLFFAVARRGDPISPGGRSPFWGPHAASVAGWFGEMDLAAEAVDARTFAAEELEKLMWNCVFGLLCQVHDAPVGALVQTRREEIDALVAELLALGGPALGVELQASSLSDRLCAYSASIPDYQGAVKEFEWRNGWFVDLAEAAGGGAAPRHARLLARLDR